MRYIVRVTRVGLLKNREVMQHRITEFQCSTLHDACFTLLGQIQDLEMDGYGPDTINHGLKMYCWAKDVADAKDPELSDDAIVTDYIRFDIIEKE